MTNYYQAHNVSRAYMFQAIVNGVLVVGLAIIGVLQIVAERSQRRCVAIKKLYHRLVLLIIALMVPQSIDPGVLGIIPNDVMSIISCNITNVVLVGVCAAVYYIHNAVQGLSLQRRDDALRSALVCLCAANTVFTNLLYALMLSHNREFFRGVAYLWWSVVFVSLFVYAFLLIARLREGIREVESAVADTKLSSQSQNSRVSSGMDRLAVLEMVGAVLLLGGLIYMGYNGWKKLTNTTQPIIRSDKSHYSVTSEASVIMHWCCVALFMWWAWIPMNFTVFVPSASAHGSSTHSNRSHLSSTVTTGGKRINYGSVSASSTVSSVSSVASGTDPVNIRGSESMKQPPYLPSLSPVKGSPASINNSNVNTDVIGPEMV